MTVTIDHEFQDDFTGDVGGEQNAHHVENPLLIVHRAFRGRYHWAIMLGLVLLAPAAIIGYKAKPPMFTSTGIIEVQPMINPILDTVLENQLMPMFDSYVETQSNFMKTQRVLALAVDSDQMREAQWPRGMAGIDQLDRATTPTRSRGGRLIFVNCEHANPATAKAGAQSVIDAYMMLHGDESAIDVETRLDQLEANRTDLEVRRKRITSDLQAQAEPWGTYDLEPIQADVATTISETDQHISSFRISITSLERQIQALGDGEEAQIDLEALKEEDPELQERIEAFDNATLGYELFLQDHGPGHRRSQALAKQVAIFDERVKERIAELKIEIVGAGPEGPTSGLGKRLEDYRDALDNALIRRDELKERARDIGNAKIRIDDLRNQERQLDARIRKFQSEIDSLRTEMQQIRRGRIHVVQNAEQPGSPSSDRRVTLAAAGAIGGFGFGAGLIGLLGFLDRRYRYLDELIHLNRKAPLLGTLPDLDAEGEEPNQIAALAVHHIRNMLHVVSPAPSDDGRIFAVTSASADEGKTSLSLALGMSFAVSGQKTLLLDTDLVGRGLSNQFGLRGLPGLTDAVNNGEDLSPYIHASPASNLTVLPSGSDENYDAEQLSEQSVRRVLNSLREEYDTIIVDTGPILGSLEADIMASLADRVVVTVSRGQTRRLVDASLSRLRHLGAVPAGVVFNRATAADITRSVSHVSMRAASMRTLPDGSGRVAARPLAPLAKALGEKQFAFDAMDSAPSSDDHDAGHELT